MNMSRYIIGRIVAISIAILLGGLVLALWRAQFDVQREGRGAADEVRLFEYLYALENGPAADIAANLAGLRAITASRNLRHVRFTLRDGDGNVLVAPLAEEPPSRLQRAFAAIAPGVAGPPLDTSAPWLLQRDDGRRFLAQLALNPASEQQEAFDNLAGMLLVLLGYAAAILVAIYWTLRRALAPMRPVLAAIDRFERNDFSQRLASLPFSETDAIGRALNHMADTLAAAQEQRRTLSLKLVSSQEDERTRLARELHDEFGQYLAAMRADVSWLARRTAGEPALQDVLAGLAAQCEHLQQGIRDLLSRLHPVDARAVGFGASLQQLMSDLVRSWSDRLGEQTRFTLRFDPTATAIADDVALTVYRLTQEALTNCVRHAHARTVAVVVAAGDSHLDWSVEDDGVGLGGVAASIQFGNGLAGMRERAWALGSDLAIGPAHADDARPGLRLAARFRLSAA
jgi:two-component system sensor histidine kinase UhpB